MTWKVLAQPGVTGAEETVRIGRSGLSCQDGGGPLLLPLNTTITAAKIPHKSAPADVEVEVCDRSQRSLAVET